MRGNATRGNKVSFGEYAIQISRDPAAINGRQIEAGRMACSHFLAREGRVYIRIFPHKELSEEALGNASPVGTGKGEPEFWAAEVYEARPSDPL